MYLKTIDFLFKLNKIDNSINALCPYPNRLGYFESPMDFGFSGGQDEAKVVKGGEVKEVVVAKLKKARANVRRPKKHQKLLKPQPFDPQV